MNKEELLYNEIYERTKDFGRTQFVREIMRLQRENKELQQKINQLETNRDEAIEYIKSNPNVYYDEYLIDVETLLENECTDEIAGDIKFISTLLSILERGKE